MDPNGYIPSTPCMYMHTWGWFQKPMLANIPYMDCVGVSLRKPPCNGNAESPQTPGDFTGSMRGVMDGLPEKNKQTQNTRVAELLGGLFM